MDLYSYRPSRLRCPTEPNLLYRAALALKAQGNYVTSVDEKAGIQALERKARDAMTHSQTGGGCRPHSRTFGAGDRTEQDFAEPIRRMVSTDSDGQWLFIADYLNTTSQKVW